MVRHWCLDYDDARRLALLEWMAKQAGIVSVSGFYGDNDAQWQQASGDVDVLESSGNLRPVRAGGGGLASIHASLTASGQEYLREIRRERSEAVAVTRACREGVLRWLYSAGAWPTVAESVPISEFFLVRESRFLGEPFGTNVVDRALAWLKSSGLVGGVSASSGLVRAILTGDGVTCVEDFDASPSAYLNRGSQTQTHHYNVSGSQIQFAAGTNIHQVMEGGATIDQMEQILQGLRLILAGAGVGIEDAEWRAYVTAAIAELQSEQPSATGMQRFTEWVQSRVTHLGDATIAAALSPVLVDLSQRALQVAHGISP